MTEPVPFFEEVAARWPGLFDKDDEWAAMVADPEHPMVPVPPPSFQELMDGLMIKLPDDVIAATADSVNAELYVKEVSDGGDEDQPVHPTVGAEHPGAEVVAGDGSGGADAQASGERVDAGSGPGSKGGAASQG